MIKDAYALNNSQLYNSFLQVQCHKKTEDELKQAILKNEAKVLALENSLEVKENQIKGLKRLIHLMQNEKDNIVLTNMELMFKVEEAKKETQQLNFYVTDYLNINENLLTLTQRKVEEVILKLKSFILKVYFYNHQC
jgi:hypothetical protein